jgi:hypothetical protein
MREKTNNGSGQTIRSPRERAGQGGVSEKTIRREIAAGNIEIVRLGPARRLIGITDAAWERYIRGRTS